MPTKIDSLEISIQAHSKGASNDIDRLVKKLDSLKKSLKNAGKNTNNIKKVGDNAKKSDPSLNKHTQSVKKYTQATNQAQKASKGLASVIGKLYANFFWIKGAANSLYKSIEKTADYAEALNYFTVTFGKVASKWDKDWENYGDENARNYGNSFVTTLNETFRKMSGIEYDPQTGLLSDTGLKNLGANLQEVTEFAAQLGSMMDAVGQSGDTTLATTNAFVKLAGDISSLYNLDYKDAASKIRSVLQGQSRAGYGFGWDTTLAALQSTADRLNLSKPVSEMTQMEKQQLRILTILEQSRVAWGDQANTMGSLANQIRMFKNNLSEASMTLGQLFVPLLSKIMPVANGVTIAIKRLMANIAGLLGLEGGDIGAGFGQLEDSTEDLEDGFEGAAEGAKKLKNAVLGIDELNINNPNASAGAGGVGGGIDLTDEITAATEEYKKVWEEAYANMESKAGEFADRFTKKLQPIFDAFKKFTEGDAFGAGSILGGLLNKKIDQADIDTATQNLEDTVKNIWSTVGGFLAGWDGEITAENLSNIASGILEALTNALKSDELDTMYDEIGQQIVELVCGVKWDELIWYVGEFLDGFLGAIIDAPITIFESIAQAIVDKIFGEGMVNVDFSKSRESARKWLLGPAWGSGISPEEKKEITNELMAEGFTKAQAKNIIGTMQTLGLDVETTKQALGYWKEESVDPMFTKEEWSETTKGMKEGVQFTWRDTMTWWDTNGAYKWREEDVKPFFKKTSWIYPGVSIGLEETFDSGTEKSKTIFQKFLDWVNERMFITISQLPDITEMFGKSTEFKFRFGRIGGLGMFADGGFPEDGLFFANHNELVGQFTNGRTAVANNEQIVAGIEGGVERAVSSVLAPYLADIARNTKETADKDFSVNIGDRDIARANRRGVRELGYALVT